MAFNTFNTSYDVNNTLLYSTLSNEHTEETKTTDSVLSTFYRTYLTSAKAVVNCLVTAIKRLPCVFISFHREKSFTEQRLMGVCSIA